MEGQWLISMVIGTPKRASSKIPPKLVTQPSDVVVFEGPFDKAPRTSKFKILNPSPDSRLGFKIKATSPKRVAVSPKCGILAPGEHLYATVSVEGSSIDEADDANGKNRPTEKLQLLSAYSEVNRFGKDFDSPIDMWGRVRPDNIAKKNLTLQLNHQVKATEEETVICGDEGFTGNVGPVPDKSDRNEVNGGSDIEPKGKPKAIRFDLIEEDLFAEDEKIAVSLGNSIPKPAKSGKNKLNGVPDPERLPKAIKLVEGLIAEKRKMDVEAMVHEEDRPGGEELAGEETPEGDSALNTWQWIGIAAAGCAAGVIGSIVAYFYFRE